MTIIDNDDFDHFQSYFNIYKMLFSIECLKHGLLVINIESNTSIDDMLITLSKKDRRTVTRKFRKILRKHLKISKIKLSNLSCCEKRRFVNKYVSRNTMKNNSIWSNRE